MQKEHVTVQKTIIHWNKEVEMKGLQKVEKGKREGDNLREKI